MSNYNIGHGHVYPRNDGMRARCGGPLLCGECRADLARQQSYELSPLRETNAQELSFYDV